MQLGALAVVVDSVQFFIHTTHNHDLLPAAETDLKFFIDFDLSILAADREIYQAYLISVRKEYRHLSDEYFAIGRKAFIQNMLSKENIFYTDQFKVREELARKNMQWELQIGSGILSAG